MQTPLGLRHEDGAGQYVGAGPASNRHEDAERLFED